MNSEEIKQFSRAIHDQLFDNLLPFWSGPALDLEQGGWVPWMSNDLRVDRSQPKGLILNTRILWAFSAAFRHRPDPELRRFADRAFDYVVKHFWDPQHGGAFWRLNDRGHVMDDSKKTYGQAFYLYALTEYYRAFQTQAALDRSIVLFGLIEDHARDPQSGGYWEVLRRDWSEETHDTRLSERDMNEKKSMNNHLHVLEAYTNLYRVWKNPLVARRLLELMKLFETRILDARTHHLHHFFDERWNVRSDTCTFGHDIEASWLLCETAEVLGDAGLLFRIRQAALKMAEAVYAEGLDAAGGLCYEGKAGRIIDFNKEWWPQAEAVVGFINAFQISGNEKHLQAAWRVWSYLETCLVDRLHGEWFSRVDANHQIDPAPAKVSEWKGPYHGVRACLESIRRLNDIAADEPPTLCATDILTTNNVNT